MQERGREHEAQAIGEPGGRGVHLRPVRVAVKDRKARDDHHGDAGRQPAAQGYQEAQNHDGKGDADLDQRDADAGHADGPGQRHGGDEGDGHEPAGVAAQVPGEETDGEHRQKVVEAAQRMEEAADKAAAVVVADMGEGHGRQEGEEGERQIRQRARHGHEVDPFVVVLRGACLCHCAKGGDLSRASLPEAPGRRVPVRRGAVPWPATGRLSGRPIRAAAGPRAPCRWPWRSRRAPP